MYANIISISIAGIGLITAGIMAISIKRKKIENKKAQEITDAIHKGSMAFLNKEYKVLFVFVLTIAALMFITPIGYKTAIAFIAGAILSAIAGNIGMRIATLANGRTAWAAKSSLHKALHIAFSSGSVMGLCVVSLGLLGIAVLYWIFKDPQIIYGFGFGASSIALFARVGGGIYTKAVDVGADLVGKVEKGIPEDDPRNPATIADNVGDNVGDVAGMGADLFESYVDSIIAAMVLGVGVVAIFGVHAITLPMLLAGAGIISALIGNIIIKLSKKGEPHKVLNRGIFLSAGAMIIGSFIILKFGNFPNYMNLFYTIITGLVSGIIIGLITEYYTSDKRKPTRNLAKSAQTGAGTNIISGLALGMKSTIIPVIVVCIAIYLSYHWAGLYGIALAAVGMLSTLGITLATDSYGPVADNAAGIAEMAYLGEKTRERAEELDAVGNTTAAIGKGFAIGSAALTAIVLSVSYAKIVGLESINIIQPKVMIGLFIGGLLPFIFSSMTMKAVGKAAFGIVEEVRRQFREIKGLMQGTAKPDYSKCVEIATSSALRQMIMPGILAVAIPVIIGFTLGAEALGGLLAGAIVTGFLMAVMMANAGGAWDNAKKYIEAGNLGGKGSEAHKAAVVGDTVGDPMKDTSGPSINILIKLMSMVAIIIAPLL
ncbi:sodium-translocating pyrophosphatase [bacterium]|nr:sodium-translocating pyrophosphatase [bacterium]